MQLDLIDNDRTIIVQKIVLELNLVFYEDVSFQDVNKHVEDIKEAIVEQLEFSFRESFPTGVLQSKQILIGNIEIEAHGTASETFGKELAIKVGQTFNEIKKEIAGSSTGSLSSDGNIIITDLLIDQKHYPSQQSNNIENASIGNIASTFNTVAVKDELAYYFVHGRTRWQTFKTMFDFGDREFVKYVEELLTADTAYFISLFSANTNAHQRFVGTLPRTIVQKYYKAVLAPFETTGIKLDILQSLVLEKADLPTQILVLRLFEINRNLIEAGTIEQKVALLVELLIILCEAANIPSLNMAESQGAYTILAKEIFLKYYPEGKTKKANHAVFEGSNTSWQQAIAMLKTYFTQEKGIVVAGAKTFSTAVPIEIPPIQEATREKKALIKKKTIEGNENGKIKIEQQAILDEIVAIASAPKEQAVAPGAHIYIRNAGIVLIAPFLSAVFERMGYLKGNVFVSPQKQERAVKMIHYLATGIHKPVNEEELIIGKILCGMHIDSFVSLKKLVVSKNEKEQIGYLFDAVKQYWPVLKNTSIENLRITFLQREGVLYTKSGNILLKIDRSTIDVLLDQIEWGFRMVKLPWCDYLLETEW